MFRAAWRNLLARKLRLVLSGFAVVLGVAFVAGVYVFTDTLDKSFDSIVEAGVGDVIVRPESAGSGDAAFAGLDGRTVPADLVDRLAEVDGAERADGNLTVTGVFVLDTDGKLIGGQGAPGIAVNYNDAPNAAGTNLLSLDQGRLPDAPGEVVLDAGTAETSGYELGDTVSLVSVGDTPKVEAELVGTFDFGTSLIGATLSVFDTDAMRDLFFDGKDVYTDIWVTADGSTDQRELRDAVEAELPDGLEAVTGQSAAEEQKDTIAEALGFINTFLLVFVVIALVVGTFLILNTFFILVAQRSRELALLRVLGASRRQVGRLVLIEAAVVGFLGSTIGIGFGFLLAMALKALFGVVGLDLADAGLEFRLRTLLVSYAVGMTVTLIAAYLPARRASRVAPVEALREGAQPRSSTISRLLVVGLVLIAIGAGLITVGLVGEGGRAALLVGIGILGVLIGVTLTSPVVGAPLLVLLRATYRRVFGAVGGLAAENALRNPVRTAVTASALMVGLALVATMSVLGASTKASVDRLIAESYTADLVVSNVIGQPFSPGIGQQVSELDGVERVAPARYTPAQVDGSDEYVAATEPEAFAEMVTLDVPEGDLADFTDGTVMVEEGKADDEGLSPGDTVTLTLPGGDQDLEVAGTYEQNPAIGAPYLFTLDAFVEGGLRPQDNYVYVQVADSASVDTVKDEMNDVVADLPLVSVKDQQAFAEEQRAQIDQLLFIVYALLALAIVIAVLGIVNTLALSVIERTREVGLLRAIGMQRRQLRRMVRLESVAIALLGAVLGMIMGVVFGVVLQRAIADQGIDVLSIPWYQLVIFVVISGLVGVLAALLPARRAARLDILTAITTE